MPEADEFSAHRDHLMAVAYRMLGSRSDAEDAVQEAWLRFAAARTEEIADLRAWLTTVTARICLDLLRSARVRREACILHVVFAVPFDVIGAVLGGTPEAARHVASRGRRAVAEGGPRHRADL